MAYLPGLLVGNYCERSTACAHGSGQSEFYHAEFPISIADFQEIHAHDLAIVRHFIDYFSGSKKLPNGGAFLAATSRSHAPVSKSMELMIKQAEERQEKRPTTPKDPFEREYDSRSEEGMKGVEVLRLRGLSKVEARGLMEYWAQSGVLRQRVDERSVAEKWALAGCGIVGEIERGALQMRI